LKLVLSRGYGVKPEYTVCPPDLDRMLADADAALLIGDIALKYYVNRKEFFLYDLGTEWKKLTGEKMVYAVWAVNRSFAGANSGLCEYVFESFRKSMDYSIEHLPEIAEYAAKWEPFTPSFLMDYFRSLHFNFGKDYQKGLLCFYQMAAGIGELDTVPELEFIYLRPRAIT
jgi:chorismate dehydratase